MSGTAFTDAALAVQARPPARALATGVSTDASALVAFAGTATLMLVAPFERLQPLIRLPAQSISNLEAAIAAAILAWGALLLWTRGAALRSTPVTAPWLVWIVVMIGSALAAPAWRTNALHMAGRLTAAFFVFLLAAHGVTSRARLIGAAAAALTAGVAVSVLVVLEFFTVPSVLVWLKAFRPQVMTVGALVRAGGTLQYPTIASMYLEIVFALGVGLLLTAARAKRAGSAAVVFASLLLVAYAITLTFTRSGIILMAVTLAWCGALRVGRGRFDSGSAILVLLAASVAAVFLSSRSLDSIRLRFTSEGQELWYSARVVAPPTVTLATGASTAVPVTITNTGRLDWSSQSDAPFFLSYHWMLPDTDQYVVFDGVRTPFDAPVSAGDVVSMRPIVRAPRHPGQYRLVWDIVQEHRTWFTDEPGAVRTITQAAVEGAPIGGPLQAFGRPRPAWRPQRLTLWRAAVRLFAEHPLFGIGPDNFRLMYAPYAGLPTGDARIHSNDMYLEVLVGGGVAGACAFVWLLWAAARMCAAGVAAGDRHQVPLAIGIAAAGLAMLVHGLVDAFLEFAPTYTMFSLTLGLAAACARGVETGADAHCV